MSSLFDSLQYITGVGPSKQKLLEKEFDLLTVEDALLYLPFRHVDRGVIFAVKDIPLDGKTLVQTVVTFANIEQVLKDGKLSRLEVTAYDETGIISIVLFKGINYFLKTVKLNEQYLVFGKCGVFNNKISFAHPEIEPFLSNTFRHDKSLEGIYHLSEKVKSKGINNKFFILLIKRLLDTYGNDIKEFLPESIITKLSLLERKKAIKNAHFPTSEDMFKRALYRLKLEELLLLQLDLLSKKGLRKKSIGHHFTVVGTKFNEFYNNYLGFELTNAQKRVIREIRKDTGSGFQANRLIQGDVGSGKTIIAFLTMLLAIDNEFQACMVAPTEILAIQHYDSLLENCSKIGVTIALLTGNIKGKKRALILEDLKNGKLNILIGTHAVMEDPVIFKNLGLAIIDEQHRFGVLQRARLWHKNITPPHILVMTATPIPRTLSMTVYGDLDVSIIDELPSGRKPIITQHYYDSSRLRVYGFLKEEIAKGRQVYIVYPLIEENEKLDFKALEDGFKGISEVFPPPQYSIVVVHGKMPPSQKEENMNLFKNSSINIMVATTVIEVGVNVPNASVMVIESAERFGLSQMHQLRGRVGRGSEQSYCILMSNNKLTNETRRKLQTMTESNDGFYIAEVDLQLRGPGDVLGTQQSGFDFNLKISKLSEDGAILEMAKDLANDILELDPKLELPEHRLLKTTLNRGKFQVGDKSHIS